MDTLMNYWLMFLKKGKIQTSAVLNHVKKTLKVSYQSSELTW